MYDIIVVGAGIAGLTAALYASRQGMKTLVVSKDLGGQLLSASEIQNYPGFASIRGADLVRRVEEQARSFGAEILFDEVVEVGKRGEKFYVKTTTGEYECLSLILAFGKTPRNLGVPGEDRLRGRGVSYCAICDGPLYRGRDVALVGWGKHGLEAALILKEFAGKLYWVFPGERPVGEGELSAVLESENVVLMPRREVVEIKGEDRVRSLLVRRKDTGEVEEVEVDGVFVEAGYAIKTDFLRGFVELNERGEIVVDKECRTSTAGVFAAGDVTDVPYKQAVISAGQGAIAALSACNYVARLKGERREFRADWRHVPRAGRSGLSSS